MPTKRIARRKMTTPTARAAHASSKRRRLREQALVQVADYLRDNGFDNPDDFKVKGGYRVEFPDFTIYASVEADGNDLIYLVGAEVMPLPSDADLVVPLMRELLQMNAVARGPARFCIDGDSIWVVAVDLVELLPDADYGRCIDAVFAWAGQAQVTLQKKYHKTTRKRR
jgi:hypothetical protein